MTTKSPLCKGTIASLAGHPSTEIVDFQHYDYKSGFLGKSTTNSTTVGILVSRGGTAIGFVVNKEFVSTPKPRISNTITLCKFHLYDLDIINTDIYPPARFNALAKRVNEHANKFTIEIPKSLNCRLLNLQKYDARHQFYYKGEVRYLENLDDLEAFIVEEFPMMEIVVNMKEEGRDMLIIQNSKYNNDFDFLIFYYSDDSKGVFSCYLEEGGSVKPFGKLLNVIGMEARE